jgi:hypothetical protein
MARLNLSSMILRRLFSTQVNHVIGGVRRDRNAGALARLRIKLCYLVRHQRLVDLDSPATFNELVQRRKLQNRDMRMVTLADKVAVKALVADALGNEWVIPTLWHGPMLPELCDWPRPFVIKSRHGTKQNIYVRDDNFRWPDLRTRAAKWMRQPYGQWLDEWLYAHIPRGILVEPFVGDDGQLPIDYKIFVFGGVATHVQVHLERENAHRWIVFDRNWNRVSAVTSDADPLAPKSLGQMLAAAEILSRGFDFVRCDFYEIGGKPKFGEMTFYPGSGLDKFNPVALDTEFGRYWLDAGGR